ncbi:MAG: glycosyltransferase family 39 protein, partial [Candidatus Omnitrophica bacterium]|nr:glycosyltransferase family 39 protein [Candidatus Omnitrophota bacterium]
MPNGPKVINPWPLALALLTVAVALANYVWLRMNQLPPVDDEAYHLWSALKYFRHLERPSFAGLGPLLNLGDLYPPLFPLLAALGARVLGAADTLTLCMANVPFVAVTFFSLYGIGLRMGDRRVGVLASCFLVLYPMFFHMGRMFMLDIALTGMVTLTLLILLCSEGFSRRGWSLLAGIALGLGLLTKQTFPVFVAGPAVYILFRSWKGLDASQRKARILHFGLFVVLGMAIAFPWYFAQAEKKFLGMKSAFLTRDRTYFDLAGSVFGTLVFYGETLVRNQMGRVFFGGFIVAVALSFKKCLRAPFVPIWFAVPFLILILFPNKWYYYTLPCLPAAAFLTAGGLLSLKRTIVRRAAVSVLILLGVEQFVVLSFMSPQLSTQLLSFSRYAPQREDYHAEALFRRLEDQRETESPVIAVPDVDPNTYSGSEGVTLG